MSKTLKERQKIARRFKGSNHYKCKCCNMPCSVTKMKPLLYEVSTTFSAAYNPVCVQCFNDDSIDFLTLFNLYTKKGSYPHEDFKESQVDKIIESFIDELKSNSTLQQKYRKYLQEDRDKKLEILFGI